MKILNIKVLRGPNYWFQDKNKLIVIKLDLEEFKNTTSIANNFATNLKELLPSLHTYQSPDMPNISFFERLEREMKLAFVIGHVAVALQNLAGMHVRFEKEVETREKDIYYIIFFL